MPDNTYREQLDQQRMETIRTMLTALPRSCADFIRGLLSTTSTLTRLAYTIDLGIFFEFAIKELPCITASSKTEITDAEIAALKPRDIEIYADYLTLYYKQNSEDAGEGGHQQRIYKNQTYGVMRKLSSLRSFFTYLFRTQRIPANTAALVPLPKKHEKPILLLEREEMQKLLDTIENGDQLTPQQAAFHKITQVRDLAIVMLFLGTGIRVSECVGIDLEDLDFRVNALLVTRKGGNQVILYFPTEVAVALQDYLAQRSTVITEPGHEHALFLSLQRRRITQRAVEQMVKKYALLVVPLKKRMSPHKLRSTYATNLYQATEDIYLVAEALGHSDVNTTRNHYASMSDARMRDAAAHTHLHTQPNSPEAGHTPSLSVDTHNEPEMVQIVHAIPDENPSPSANTTPAAIPLPPRTSPSVASEALVDSVPPGPAFRIKKETDAQNSAEKSPGPKKPA